MVAKKTVHERVIREVIEKPVKKKTKKKKTTKKKKKTTKKKTARKKTTRKAPAKNNKIEKALIDNFVSLQKVMVNLSVKFDNLSNHISKLLDLFEISAKALAEKNFDLKKNVRGEEEISRKMDSILDQNKVIARGLTLMHDRVEEKLPFPDQNLPVNPPTKSPVRKINPGFQGYQASISSKQMESP